MEFTKIKKITKNIKQCYDVTVINNHNLFINKHLIHNSDYRGPVGVILMNSSNKIFNIKRGDRVAQLVVTEFKNVELEESDELSSTNRGEMGFGSTGVK